MSELPTHLVVVGGFVINEQDKVLLIKSPRRGWEFPGGKVENGESLPQALIREIREESGITVKIKNIVGIYSNTSKRKGYNSTVVSIDFMCEYVYGELCTSDESIEVGWFTKDESLNLIKLPRKLYRFENMLGFNGRFHVDAFKEPFEFIEKNIFPR